MIQTGFKSTILKEGYKEVSEKFDALIKARIEYWKFLQTKDPDEKTIKAMNKEKNNFELMLGFLKVADDLIEALEEDLSNVSSSNSMNKRMSDFYYTELIEYMENFLTKDYELCEMRRTFSENLTALSKANDQQLNSIRESLKQTT